MRIRIPVARRGFSANNPLHGGTFTPHDALDGREKPSCMEKVARKGLRATSKRQRPRSVFAKPLHGGDFTPRGASGGTPEDRKRPLRMAGSTVARRPFHAQNSDVRKWGGHTEMQPPHPSACRKKANLAAYSRSSTHSASTVLKALAPSTETAVASKSVLAAPSTWNVSLFGRMTGVSTGFSSCGTHS